jgi:hypothetical protein
MKCLRCNHEWQSRVENPKRCPNCKSPYWKQPKERVHYIKNEGVKLPDIPPKSVILLGNDEQQFDIPSKLYAPLKIRLLTAMRDRLPLKVKVKNGEITDIL